MTKKRARPIRTSRKRDAKSKPSYDPCTQHAVDVVDGRIVTGRLALAAARRHIDDLEKGHKRGLVWDAESAQHALNFPPSCLTVTAGALEGNPFSLLPWHTFCVGSMFGWRTDTGRMRFRRAWFETGKGQAKALALDTPIPTPSGWVTMGDIKTGDIVFADDGAPCRVTLAHEVLTDRECYRVTFDDGAVIVADAGHLWRTEMRKSGNKGHGDATRGVGLRERGAWRNGIRTTAEIAATLRYANGKYQCANHSVALAGAVKMPVAELDIPPYVLGFWLGDGDSDGARVTISDTDAPQSLAALRAAGAKVGERRGGEFHAGRYSVSLSAPVRKGFGARLKARGLYGNKHIPADYLRASIDQRLALLQGLMDTDGTVAEGGQCSFCGINESLCKGVLELALSLGLKATMVEKSAKLNGRRICASYHVNFYAPPDMRVFTLERKQSRVAPKHSRRRLSGERRIVACEKVDSVPVRCISVDSPSRMFLCGQEMIPTHNSPLMAAVGLYLLGFYGIQRAELYAIGQDRNVANVLFRDAVSMCRAPMPGYDEGEDAPTLETIGEVILRGTLDNTHKIEHPDSGSFFRPLANGEAISGPRPVAVFADEIHEFKESAHLETWSRAIAKMPGDAIMILGTNTPASTQVVGTAYSEFYQKVAKGEVRDDSAFAYIARVDSEDHEGVFDNEACWVKALPALGVTFPPENIRDEVATAKVLLSTAMSVKRLYFGIPTGTVDFWIDELAWNAVQGEFSLDDMRDYPCWLSLDLSQKNDLTALTLVWKAKDGHLFAHTWYFAAKVGIEDRSKRDGVPYDLWAKMGILEAVPGPVVDKRFVAAKVQSLAAVYDVQFMVFDPAGIGDFIQACDDIGFAVWKWEGPNKPSQHGLKLISHAQGTRIVFNDTQFCMPRSMEAFEDAILDKRITIASSKLTNSCAANAAVKTDAQQNRCFDKKRSFGRIDGVVTLAMGVGAAKSDVVEEPTYQMIVIG